MATDLVDDPRAFAARYAVCVPLGRPPLARYFIAFIILARLQTEGVRIVDRIPGRIPIEIEPTRNPNGILLGELLV